MSLSTLLEAAKYLDYLDSNPNLQQQHQQQYQQQQHPQLIFKPQQTTKQKSNRRQRASKKSAANTMIAMSLPSSMGPIQMQSVPIPFVSSNSNHAGNGSHHHQAASLSSSFTTGSPLSSFASTALFCSKASGVTSASSSAASSLSSSDSSSSCGEILMGDNDFNQSLTATSGGKQQNNRHQRGTKQSHGKNAHSHHNYHLTHQPCESTNQIQHLAGNNNSNRQSIARYIAATSNGPQLVTMTTSSSVASASAPIDSSLRAGHVIHAANNGAILTNTATSFDPRHFSIAPASGNIHQQTAFACQEGQAFNITEANGVGSFGNDNQFNGSPSSCPPLIMTRVQPMILNSLSPSTHQSIMAFQQAIASSPTSSSSSYSRHRELHKTLEKNRRAHLRHCFELLRTELPASECVDKKTSHINIIKSAIRYVLALRQQECEIDTELQRLTRIKNELTENLSKIGNANKSQQGAEAAQQHIPPSEHQLKQEQQLQQEKQQQPPPPEQQLSFLLSQSKID